MDPDFELDPGIPSSPKLKHSGPGLTSLVLSLVGHGLIWGSGFAIAALAVIQKDDFDENALVWGGFVIFGGVGLNLIAVVMGMIGMFQKDRSKILTIAGLGISTLTVAGSVLFLLIGVLRT